MNGVEKNNKKQEYMKKGKHIFWELILVFSSVFIFRGLWTLMDRIEILNESLVHLIILTIGTILFIWAIDKLTHKQ